MDSLGVSDIDTGEEDPSTSTLMLYVDLVVAVRCLCVGLCLVLEESVPLHIDMWVKYVDSSSLLGYVVAESIPLYVGIVCVSDIYSPSSDSIKIQEVIVDKVKTETPVAEDSSSFLQLGCRVGHVCVAHAQRWAINLDKRVSLAFIKLRVGHYSRCPVREDVCDATVWLSQPTEPWYQLLQ